jgi:hypothetical protein
MCGMIGLERQIAASTAPMASALTLIDPGLLVRVDQRLQSYRGDHCRLLSRVGAACGARRGAVVRVRQAWAVAARVGT